MLPGWENLGVEPHPLALEKMGVGFPHFFNVSLFLEILPQEHSFRVKISYFPDIMFEAYALSLFFAMKLYMYTQSLLAYKKLS